MVHSKPKECVMIDGSRFCKSEITTPKDLAAVLIGVPVAFIFWAITGFVVAKIVSKYFDINFDDNPVPLLLGVVVPPMLVGVIILLFN